MLHNLYLLVFTIVLLQDFSHGKRLERRMRNLDGGDCEICEVDEGTSSGSGSGYSTRFKGGYDRWANTSHMTAALEGLSKFVENEVQPVLAQKAIEDIHINGSTSSGGTKNSHYLCLLEGLKKHLNSDRPGHQSRNLEVDIVKSALDTLSNMYTSDLITKQQVQGFFQDEETIKTVGKYLVYIYGEEYPNLTKHTNFKPDIDFLKRDRYTSDLHWFLEIIDKRTEGKIIYRSMQTFFEKMTHPQNVGAGFESVKWKTFLSDDTFIKKFPWKESPQISETDVNNLVNYLLKVWGHMSQTNNREEFLSSFWIVAFSITYGTNDAWNQLTINSSYKGFKGQYELIEALLKRNEILNRLYAKASRFDSRKQVIFISGEGVSDSWLKPVHPEGEEAELFEKMQVRYERLTAPEHLDSPEMRAWKDSTTFVSILNDFTKPRFLMNEWLQGMEVIIDEPRSPSASSSREEAPMDVFEISGISPRSQTSKNVTDKLARPKSLNKFIQDKFHRVKKLFASRESSSSAP